MASVFGRRFSQVEDPSDAFKELVQRDPRICNNCFRRTHNTFERNFVTRISRGEMWAKEVGLSPRSFPIASETQYAADVPMTQGTRRVCICGGVKLRPMLKLKAMRCAARIADRLERKHVVLDEEVFIRTVWDMLKVPKNQGRQDSVFATAVEEALVWW